MQTTRYKGTASVQGFKDSNPLDLEDGLTRIQIIFRAQFKCFVEKNGEGEVGLINKRYDLQRVVLNS